jgi:hypothetical protein
MKGMRGTHLAMLHHNVDLRILSVDDPVIVPVLGLGSGRLEISKQLRLVAPLERYDGGARVLLIAACVLIQHANGFPCRSDVDVPDDVWMPKVPKDVDLGD